MLTILFNQGVGASFYYRPTGGGGSASGGSGHWYTGKYKGELKAAITRAIRTLSKTTDKRKRKRIIRKVAEVFVPEMVSVPTWIAPIDQIQIQIVLVSRELKAAEDRAATQKLSQLLQDYEEKAKKIEQQEEEAIAAILLLAA